MTYMNAEMELVKFAAEDVLATSNGNETPVETEPTRVTAPVLPDDEF